MRKFIHYKRLAELFMTFAFIFIFLAFAVVKLQLKEQNKLKTIANSQYEYRENLSDLKYQLLDENGKDLLNYEMKYEVVVIPNSFKKNFSDKEENEKLLTFIYVMNNYKGSTGKQGDDEFDIKSDISQNQNVIMRYEIDEQTYEKLKGLSGLKGVYMFEHSQVDRKEAWKFENMLTSTVHVNEKGDPACKSNGSLEVILSKKTEKNAMPQAVFDKNVDGTIEKVKEQLPKENVNVKTTLNRNFQDRIKDVLQKSKYSSMSNAGVVVMEAKTGRIKALVQKDDSKPNVIAGASTQNGLYPGSIFKVLVEEAALEKGGLDLAQTYSCMGSHENENHKHHGNLQPREAMAVSCNDIFGQIATETGGENIYDMARKQGLFEKVLGLEDEQKGAIEIEKPTRSNGTSYMAAIGQGVRITPLEALAIPNTAVNDGAFVKPHAVDSLIRSNNEKVESYETITSKVMEKKTARELKAQMIDVVEKGTGTLAKVKGMEIGGKTGTTERGKSSDGWFAGFFKAADGKYYSAVVVCTDIDPDKDSAGTTAAPIFADVARCLNDALAGK